MAAGSPRSCLRCAARTCRRSPADDASAHGVPAAPGPAAGAVAGWATGGGRIRRGGGTIGVGKTTLARLLAAPLRAAAVLEVVEENPFLHHFYQDMRGYAFQTQIFFFLSRYRQQEVIRRAREQGQSIVSDYMFAKDRLFAQMNLDTQELDLYTRLFSLIAPMTVRPALVICLTAHLETLLDRIAHRDRPFEQIGRAH